MTADEQSYQPKEALFCVNSVNINLVLPALFLF